MAIDILSILAMSAEAERVFLCARRTILWSRYRLGATVVEQTECLKSWVREVVESGSSVSAEVVAEVLNIKGGVVSTYKIRPTWLRQKDQSFKPIGRSTSW